MTSTKKDVQNAFDRFTKLYNLKTSATTKSQNPSQPDFYSNEFIKLDYASCYGGYRLDVVQKGTGERFFDSMSRRSAKEMIAYLQGLMAAKCAYCFENIVKENTK